MEATTQAPTPTQTTATESTAAPEAAAAAPAAAAPEAPAAVQATTDAQAAQPQQSTTATETPAATADAGPKERVVPKPSEYVLPEGMPDAIRNFAHSQGFTQEQLTAALQHFGTYTQQARVAEQAILRQMGEDHVKSWGADSKQKLALARAAIRQLDTDGSLLKMLNETGYGNHPVVLNFLYNQGKSLQEGGFLKSAVVRKPGEKTAAQAMYGDNHPSANI